MLLSSVACAFVACAAVQFPEVVIPRASVGNAQNLFNANDRGTVAFIGGSITEMEGYRPRMVNDLRKRFPKASLSVIASGVSSTCSDTGAFRFEEDILSQGVPDLLFLEFAVNDTQDGFATILPDAKAKETRSVRAMEGIIRHARRINPAMDIIMVLVDTIMLFMILPPKPFYK